MQLSKRLFSKLKKKLFKQKEKTDSSSILANRDEFVYDDHISLYSFTDDASCTTMLKSHYPHNVDNIDIIISCYTEAT